MAPLVPLLAVAGSYLAGTFPSAQLVGRWRGVDPTRTGSGNPGATNVLRTAGRRAAALTLAGDVAKGAVPAAAGWALGGHTLGVVCGLAAIVGHVAPATRRFRGGKGVATGVGAMAVVFPLPALAGAAAFALVLAVTRIAAVASLAGTLAALAATAALRPPGWELLALVACSAVIVVRHGGNLRRLVRGEERRTARFRPGSGLGRA